MYLDYYVTFREILNRWFWSRKCSQCLTTSTLPPQSKDIEARLSYSSNFWFHSSFPVSFMLTATGKGIFYLLRVWRYSFQLATPFKLHFFKADKGSLRRRQRPRPWKSRSVTNSRTQRGEMVPRVRNRTQVWSNGSPIGLVEPLLWERLSTDLTGYITRVSVSQIRTFTMTHINRMHGASQNGLINADSDSFLFLHTLFNILLFCLLPELLFQVLSCGNCNWTSLT